MKNKFLNKKILGKFINIINIFFIIISIFLTSTKGVDSMGAYYGPNDTKLDLTYFQDLFSNGDKYNAAYVYKGSTQFHNTSTGYHYKGTELYFGGSINRRFPNIGFGVRLDDGWFVDDFYVTATSHDSGVNLKLDCYIYDDNVDGDLHWIDFETQKSDDQSFNDIYGSSLHVRKVEIKATNNVVPNGEFKVGKSSNQQALFLIVIKDNSNLPLVSYSGIWKTSAIKQIHYFYGNGSKTVSRDGSNFTIYTEYYDSADIPLPPPKPPAPDPEPPVESIKAPRIESGYATDGPWERIHIYNDNSFPVKLHFRYHDNYEYGSGWYGPSSYQGQSEDIQPGKYMYIESGCYIMGYCDYKFVTSSGESEVVTWQFPDSSY